MFFKIEEQKHTLAVIPTTISNMIIFRSHEKLTPTLADPSTNKPPPPGRPRVVGKI